MDVTRRTLLQGSAGALAAGTLAGCLDDVARQTEGVDSGYAAFFALWDWANAVSGDEADFENPVDAGELGHGWEPEGDLTADVAGTDAFVYLDSPEFSWAQDIATTLEEDYDDVAVVDVLDGLEDNLLDWDHDADHEHEDEHDEEDDHDDEHNEEHDHDDDGHDENDDNYDPHVWVDPVLAQDLVTNIADGLSDADPDAADVYEDNAADYNARLEELDEQFEAVVDEADRTVAVLAGHNSYQYLEERYGFELHAPIGVSPQDEPNHGEISETIDLIDEEGIDTILYDRFEATGGDEYPNLVETILEGSEATDAMPVSPTEGTLEEWNDKGWGYVEQMEEINILAFREGLGAQ
ncbi:metal ABC transporter substrate-binding protein [Natronococcus wangiae]|uniref:metal ABC transporter substrate-binding protein n=1 Tax=Natronococcus wangiae TaxID=3068275 RepID=UPI00273F2DE5|nr:zinc ABC transporter substrate-binding protein [Natronococcus sp. AD5]